MKRDDEDEDSGVMGWIVAVALAVLLAAALILPAMSARAQTLRSAITEQEAQQAHARGQCGTLGPGTGLGPDGRGWIVSMLPGRHEFRVAGGTVGVTVARYAAFDFDIGRPYYIVVDAPPGAVLEWRMAGHDWGPVATAFLYPPSVRTR